MILRHQVYSLNGISGNELDHLVVEDVTLFSMPGMGVICSRCKHVTMQRTHVLKRDWAHTSTHLTGRRPMSITADGAHFTSSRGGNVKLSGCTFEGQGDDGVNMPSRYWSMRQIAPD